MNYQKIVKYSMYPQRYTAWTLDENISHVVDKMLRVTTKLTESYADDIICTIKQLYRAVEQKIALHTLLSFRENGVNKYQVLYDIGEFADNSPLKANGTELQPATENNLGILNFFQEKEKRMSYDELKLIAEEKSVAEYVEPRDQSMAIQHWEIIHDPKTTLTVFRRVRLTDSDIPCEKIKEENIMARVKVGEETKELSYIDLLSMLQEDVEEDYIMGILCRQEALSHIEELQRLLYNYSY